MTESEEKNLFLYQIWELENMVIAANNHLTHYKKTMNAFKNPSMRIKGKDTIFYEMNINEWSNRLEISKKKFSDEYGHLYNRKIVKFPWDDKTKNR